MLQVYLLVGAEDSEPFEVDLRLEMIKVLFVDILIGEMANAS